MPTPPLANADSTAILKPVVPIRRRSARLSTPATSKAPAASNPTNELNNMPSSLSQSISLNGVPLLPKDSIQELDEPKDAWSSAVPNGHAHVQAAEPTPNGLNELKPVIESPPAPEAAEPVIAKEVVRPAVATEPAKAKIDWEIPRKTLHSSIGVITLAAYLLDFTIPPIVGVLSILLASIAALDFVRLRNPEFERLYEKSVGFLMRESEKEKVNGTVWYLIGVIFVLTFYPADIAVVSILILSWADTAASTIGRLWGRYTPPLPRRIPYIGLRFAPRKSTAGYSAAFVTGGIITAVFLSNHATRNVLATSIPAAHPPFPSWDELKSSQWEALWPLVQSYTNFNNIPVEDLPSSWGWTQRVGGGLPGLAVLGLWSGFVTAVSEAIDLGDMDDNLTLPILSGLGIWAYTSLLNWIDLRML